MAFNFKEPDYASVFNERIERLTRIRAAQAEHAELRHRLHNHPPEMVAEWDAENPSPVSALRTYYRDHLADFINDWGVTFDPRNVDVDLPALIPFVLFDKQREFIEWVLEHWRSRKPGIAEKSRDMGASWLAVSLAASICLHYDGVVIGFGSRKEEYVDKLDSPKSLFYKARMFLRYLPPEFCPGWDPKRHAPHMRINFPDTGSYIAGEAGDGIGRGDRASIYVVDESAHLEHPELVDAALSQTTNCRIDMSSVNGMANSFAQRRHSGKIDVFTFHWQDDPRKDDAWYAKMCDELDPVTVAQEIDINYNASAEGVLIPSAWINAAIDAHTKLGHVPTGRRKLAFDVADEGKDKNATAGATGWVLDFLDEWSGKGDDIFGSVERVFGTCASRGFEGFAYDGDGLGAGVRGDARRINEDRLAAGMTALPVELFRGSGGVLKPESEDEKGRKNQDFFMNRKAQAWWALRQRFRNTYRAVVEGHAYNADDLISLSSTCGPLLNKLKMELVQPTFTTSVTGKIVVDKTPEGVASPNLADAVMILFHTGRRGFRISDGLLGRV